MLTKLRRAFRRDDDGAGMLVSFIVGTAVFVLTTTVLINFVAEPPGAGTSALEQEDLRSKGNELLHVLLATQGYPHSWDTDASSIDSVDRLGMLQAGSSTRMDPQKFDAIARGKFKNPSATNGVVDYDEAKRLLGISGYDFHLRANPVFDAFAEGTYGMDGLVDFRIGYIGHWDSVIAESGASASERATLAALRTASAGELMWDNAERSAITGTGDVFRDDSATLKSLLVPLLGAATAQTIIPGGSANQFAVVNDTAYKSLVPLTLAPTKALALTDGDKDPTIADLGYTKNKEVRAVLGTANFQGIAFHQLAWSEFVHTSGDAGDHGYVEASVDGGATWIRLQDIASSGYSKSEHSGTSKMMSRSINITAANCAPCDGVAEVQIAFHWIADNDAVTSEKGWIIDDVQLTPTALTGFHKTFEKPYYDMLIMGSNIGQTAFTPAEVKHAIRDYVNTYGGRILVMGGEQNTQWLQPLFHVGIKDASPGVSTPDTTHPLLTVPNELDYESYDYGGGPGMPGDAWDFGGTGDASLFNQVVGTSTGQSILTVARSGAFYSPQSDGSVMLTTYLPYTMSSEQAKRFLANAITYGKYHHLYLDFGPSVPDGVPVTSIARTASMDKTRDGSGLYIEMALVLYVWKGDTSGVAASGDSLPAAPANLQAAYGNNEVALEWDPVFDWGTGTAEGYHIWRGTTSHAEVLLDDVNVAVLTFVDDTAVNGVTYYYYVSAKSSVGMGAFSNEVSATPATAPGAVTTLTVTNTTPGQLALSWGAPASNGGLPITQYRIDRGATAGALAVYGYVGNVLTTTDAGLGNGDEYCYRVAAVTTAAEGAPSPVVCKSTLDAPDVPAGLTATGGLNAITLAWPAPADGGATLSAYNIYAGDASGALSFLASVTGSPPLPTFTESGLGFGQTRYYQVSAVNAIAETGLSAEVSGASATPPLPISLVTVSQNGAATLKLQWSAPTSELSITGYKIYRGTLPANAVYVTTVAGTLTQYNDTGLGNGVTRYYNVTAVNAAGESASSPTSSGTTLNVPGAPTIVATPYSGHRVLVTITAPASNGGSPVTDYQVYHCQNAGCTPTYYQNTSGSLTFIDSQPAALQSWSYKVSAVNAVGAGALSAVATTVTT